MKEWQDIDMNLKTKKKIGELIFVGVILGIVILLYTTIIARIAPLFEMDLKEDQDIIKNYLRAFGWKGPATVALLDMLQMIIIIIPAEFLHISAGIAYPIYVMLPVCSFGLFLGASAIFFIVRLLGIRLDFLEKKTGKIQKVVSHINQGTSMQIIMYLLFMTPMIPFGATSYFAATSDISYRRYAFTVITGTIPSILISYLLGNVVYQFASQSKGSLWIAIVAVALVIIGLIYLMFSLIKRKFYTK